MTSGSIVVCRYDSPCGVLRLGSYGDALCLCDWEGRRHRACVDRRLRRLLAAEFADGISPVLNRAVGQLDEYFAGARREFQIPLLFAGTDFQQRVWHELLSIPYGATISYAGLAARIGQSGSVRAVANANGANAISIFAPCHRVIGSDGSLSGYSGGIGAKRYLLKLEEPNTIFDNCRL